MARTGRPRKFDRDIALEAAMNIFWAKGFESTSLADLRDTLNLSSASFYAAFGSKKELFEECLSLYTQTCGEVTSYLDNDSVRPREAMQNMLNHLIEVQTSSTSPLGCMAVLSGLNCCDDNKDVEELTYQVRNKTTEAILRCVIRAIGKGELPEDINADAYALMIDSFVKGISIKAKDGYKKKQLQEAVGLLLSNWQ